MGPNISGWNEMGCVAAEVARSDDAALATADPHLLDLCREEAIDVIVLPDRGGR